MAEYERASAAGGHMVVLACVVIFGALALSDHPTVRGLILWVAAMLLTAVAPLLWSLIRAADTPSVKS